MTEARAIYEIPGLNVAGMGSFMAQYDAISAGQSLTRSMQALTVAPIPVEGPDGFQKSVVTTFRGFERMGLTGYITGVISEIRAGRNAEAPTAPDGLPAAGWTKQPAGRLLLAPVWLLWERDVWYRLPDFAACIAHEAAHLYANRRDEAIFLDERGPVAVGEAVLSAFLRMGY